MLLEFSLNTDNCRMNWMRKQAAGTTDAPIDDSTIECYLRGGLMQEGDREKYPGARLDLQSARSLYNRADTDYVSPFNGVTGAIGGAGIGALVGLASPRKTLSDWLQLVGASLVGGTVGNALGTANQTIVARNKRHEAGLNAVRSAFSDSIRSARGRYIDAQQDRMQQERDQLNDTLPSEPIDSGAC